MSIVKQSEILCYVVQGRSLFVAQNKNREKIKYFCLIINTDLRKDQQHPDRHYHAFRLFLLGYSMSHPVPGVKRILPGVLADAVSTLYKIKIKTYVSTLKEQICLIIGIRYFNPKFINHVPLI